jgi:hypothetical protein
LEFSSKRNDVIILNVFNPSRLKRGENANDATVA